jgi:hypothetical protein
MVPLMGAWNFITSNTTEASRTLTLGDMKEAVKVVRESEERHATHAGERAAAWASLNLDYDAMTDEERYLAAIGQASEIVHPSHGTLIHALVDKYRRDR